MELPSNNQQKLIGHKTQTINQPVCRLFTQHILSPTDSARKTLRNIRTVYKIVTDGNLIRNDNE